MYNGLMFPPPQQQATRCCGCFSLRFGSGVICLIWAAFSMYLAVLSFQNQSLFYSHLPQAPFMIYGVVNLILSLVSVGGLVILIINVGRYVRTLSHAIFVSVFLVLVDGFINVILFITNQSNFYTWCVDTSSGVIVDSINNNNTTNTTNNTTVAIDFFTSNDFYNCHQLWQDELKFGIIFYILMFAFYVYWALSIYTFSLIRREYFTSADVRSGIPPPTMMGSAPNVVAVPPPTATANGFPSDREVIILNNQKPSSATTTKKKQQLSFRNYLKKSSIMPTSSNSNADHQLLPFSLANDTIGFRVGPNGNIIDIESQPLPQPLGSPTPTFISNNGSSQIVFFDSNQQQQLKRKPVTKEDDGKGY